MQSKWCPLKHDIYLGHCVLWYRFSALFLVHSDLLLFPESFIILWTVDDETMTPLWRFGNPNGWKPVTIKSSPASFAKFTKGWKTPNRPNLHQRGFFNLKQHQLTLDWVWMESGPTGGFSAGNRCACVRLRGLTKTTTAILLYLAKTARRKKEASRAAVTGWEATQRRPKTRRGSSRVEPGPPGSWINRMWELQLWKVAGEDGGPRTRRVKQKTKSCFSLMLVFPLHAHSS